MSATRNALVLSLLTGMAAPAAAQTYTTLHSFPRPAKGDFPIGIFYRNGFLYGATQSGGNGTNGGGDGVLFKIKVATGRASTLHVFAGPDGAQPKSAPLALGTTLYGVTSQGGSGDGVVYTYDLKTNAFSVLRSFTGNPDGAGPSGGLQRHNGLLYGATPGGGTLNEGTIYSVDPASGNETVLYESGTPFGPLVYDRGSFFGYGQGGKKHGNKTPAGEVFRYDLDTNRFRILHTFYVTPGGQAPDGTNPSGLTAHQGLLYGVTANGGEFGGGTIYQIAINGSEEQTLLHFKSKATGLNPLQDSGLVYDNNVLYGITEGGGSSGAGVIYKFDLVTRKESVLYNFPKRQAGLAARAFLTVGDGVLYGTTAYGGDGDTKTCGHVGCGTVFSLTP